jgi:hypothetical protein
VLAHNNPHGVLDNGKGIDHGEDSPILAAAMAAVVSCGIPLDEESEVAFADGAAARALTASSVRRGKNRSPAGVRSRGATFVSPSAA